MEGGVTPFSSSMAPSGSYILIVVSQPLTEEHKQIILERLNKGLLSWDVSSTGCDLSGLEYAFSANIKDSVTESDVLIQHSTESLGVEVLLSPTVRTLTQCVKNLLSTPTSHKQLIHAGYTFAGSGSWILENGTFSFREFLDIFKQAGVQSHKRCSINVHCTEEGEWSKTNFARDIFTKSADVALNPPEKVSHVPGSEHLIKCLESALNPQSLEEMMKPSPLVGNIRFNRPTIYMFPAGQGDCALFGINGFNMLIDGGFHRKPCSWDFVRHLDRLDAVLVTRIGESNVCGMSTLMKRNALNNANPQIGYVFCNIAENKPGPTKNGTTEAKDDLLVSVVNEGHNFVQTLNDLKLKPHQCWRDSSIDPFVLYHKVGQGTLEMHVLSPPRDSKEMKLFLSEWNAYKETFSTVKSELKNSDNKIPLSHATSICAILVWRPEDPKDTITRILFPGSAPQNKILEGLEKLKVLNILNQPVVTKASLNIPSSKVISSKIEKSVSRASIPNRNNTASPALSVSSMASRNGDVAGLKKDVKDIKRVTKEVKKEIKEVKKDIKKDIKKDLIKDTKKEVKSENAAKKDLLIKKDSVKDTKKEVKKVVKKENKEVKAIADKKEVKPTPKKESTTPTVKATAEVKKSTSVAKKSTTPVKKDVGKPPIAPKDAKKSLSKVSEPKTPKEVNNKKSTESKSVAKAKPKSNSASPKTPTAPKTKPVAVPKPGSKMTKAVAASSIVASAVAVTVAAVELNEKKDNIEDIEPEISEKEAEIVAEPKEVVANEKSTEDVISPLPPEALSPTPSESVSLTPSDTLSSAPLETVSPTPPLPNEPMSTEEKDVNEIKDLDQDMPYEEGKQDEEAEIQNEENNDLKTENEVNDIEAELVKHQASSDVMSTSFIAEKQMEDMPTEEQFNKTEFEKRESVPLKVDIDNDDLSGKDDISVEKDTAEEKGVTEEKYVEENNMEEENVVQEGETFHEKDIADEKDVVEEKQILGEQYLVEEKYSVEEKHSVEDYVTLEEKQTVEEMYSAQEKDIDEEKDVVEEKDTIEEKYIAQERESDEEKDTIEEKYIVQERETDEEKDTMEEKYIAQEKETDEERDTDEEKETDEDIDVVEEKDDVKEKDIVEVSNVSTENDIIKNDDDINVIDENEYKSSYEINAKDIDSQLAGLSMEGSFCTGMMSSAEQNTMSTTEIEHTQMEEDENASYDHTLGYNTNVVEEQYEKNIISESGNYLKRETPEPKVVENQTTEEYKEYSIGKHDQSAAVTSENYEAQLDDSQIASNKVEATENNQISPEENENLNDEEEDEVQQFIKTVKSESTFEEPSQQTIEGNKSHFDNFSHMHSMEASFHQDAYDNYEPTNIDDLEMQETSVDEPEEIIRKESDVSIILNDENPEDHYMDSWRRKSGTESEDDVDIGKYMTKEHTLDEERLHVQRESDSDEEDVVKSPTPHAVVDYEGQLDEMVSKTGHNVEEENEKEIVTGKEVYVNEKDDFNEKDRDSAEEQDTDDGEMIRHPTPPGMKYSEEEMRDPIGQHFITNPSLKPQGIDITEQPLYEEAEDSGSERSASPIIEQPVFGNVVQADFPELVTVSGGTTPSEPQSPKANFDNKKFPTETAVMEALSEHDISESSTHSPSCQDGSTAFDLQGSERSVIEVQSLQEDEVSKATPEKKPDLPLHDVPSESDGIIETEKPSIIETAGYDDKEDTQEEKQETPSDEEESSSEDENSESHSKDKSDAMGDRSDVERDDRSDIHNDDKSDHHHDGKSDVLNDDDDDKSDIPEDEQLYRQHNKYMEFESEEKSSKIDFQDEADLRGGIREDDQYEKQYSLEDHFKNPSNAGEEKPFSSGLEIQNSFVPSEPVDIGSANVLEENNETLADITYDGANSGEILNPLPDEKGYDTYEKHNEPDSRNILEYETAYATENYETHFLHESSDDAFISKNTFTTDYDLKNTQSSQINEIESSDKIEDSGNGNNFRADETHFENSESDNYIHGFNTFASKSENENARVEPDSGDLMANVAEYSQEVPTGFGNPDNFERHENEIFKDDVELHEDISPQHAENVTVVENKIITEVTDAHQYENLSHYGENMHISNETYSESTLIKNTVSDESGIQTYHAFTEESNISEKAPFNYANPQLQSFSSNNTYDYPLEAAVDKFNNVRDYPDNDSNNEVGLTEESLYKTSQFEYAVDNTVETLNNTDDYKQLTENYSHASGQDDYIISDSYSEKTLPIPIETSTEQYQQESTEVVTNSGFVTEVADINFNDEEKEHADASEFAMVNGKNQASYGLPPSEMTAEFFNRELPHKEDVSSIQQVEQESNYLINNRFQSDSPEDNTMRSDSSPDVPYPADLPDKFCEIKNTVSNETCSETYIHNTEDYKNNMNFSSTDGIPLSSHNHSLNANQNNTYVESSEEEAVMRGNISPYAYTNKAYTREEEDIDGNRIYKEESTEVLKQVEFDGNNLQPLSTSQVTSTLNYSQEYQDVQYSTGANYDFHLEEWGKPMGLPTPPDSTQKTVKKSEKLTVKSKTAVDANGKVHSPSVSSKVSSPLKKPKPKVAKESSSSPVYVDLAYVPQHADPQYCDVEFFKKIRARYYVISSVNPSKEVLNALLEAKKTWNEDISVTIIPTYETDTLGYWMAQNQNDLAEYSIDVSPSASRCTVNLQDHQTSCSAYRLEF